MCQLYLCPSYILSSSLHSNTNTLIIQSSFQSHEKLVCLSLSWLRGNHHSPLCGFLSCVSYIISSSLDNITNSFTISPPFQNHEALAFCRFHCHKGALIRVPLVLILFVSLVYPPLFPIQYQKQLNEFFLPPKFTRCMFFSLLSSSGRKTHSRSFSFNVPCLSRTFLPSRLRDLTQFPSPHLKSNIPGLQSKSTKEETKTSGQ